MTSSGPMIGRGRTSIKTRQSSYFHLLVAYLECPSKISFLEEFYVIPLCRTHSIGGPLKSGILPALTPLHHSLLPLGLSLVSS